MFTQNKDYRNEILGVGCTSTLSSYLKEVRLWPEWKNNIVITKQRNNNTIVELQFNYGEFHNMKNSFMLLILGNDYKCNFFDIIVEDVNKYYVRNKNVIHSNFFIKNEYEQMLSKENNFLNIERFSDMYLSVYSEKCLEITKLYFETIYKKFCLIKEEIDNLSKIRKRFEEQIENLCAEYKKYDDVTYNRLTIKLENL